MNTPDLEQFVARGRAAQKAVDSVIQKHRRSRVINRDYVKRWTLDYASTNRLHKFSRVSESFLNMIEADTKTAIRNRVMRHPSLGKTLK